MPQDPAHSTAPRWERILVAVLWALAVWLIVVHVIQRPLANYGVDYPKHWAGARRLLAGENPFLGEWYLAYPLFTGYAFLYLAPFSYETAEIVWDVGNILFSLGGMLVLARWVRPRLEAPEGFNREEPPLAAAVASFLRRHWTPCVFLMVAAYQPLHRVLIASNVDPFSFILAIAFTAFFVNRRDRWAGVALAALALVKLAPIFLLIPVAAARRWRVAAWCLGALFLYHAILVATGMWRVELTLYTEVLPRLPVEWRALSFSVHRTAADFILPELFADGEMYKRLIFGLNAVMMAAYLAVTAWWMRSGARKADEYLAFGFFMVLLFTPLLEINHLLWVTSAILLQLRGWLDGRIGPRGFAALAVGWGLFMALETLLAIPGQWKLPLQGYWLQTAALVYMTTVSGVVAFRGRRG